MPRWTGTVAITVSPSRNTTTPSGRAPSSCRTVATSVDGRIRLMCTGRIATRRVVVAAATTACSTSIGTRTTVPDAGAVSVSVAAPAGVPAGSVTVTVAAPAATGTSPSAVSPRATCSVVFSGAPRLVRFSPPTWKVTASPAVTVSGTPLTCTPCFANEGASGEPSAM